MDVGLAPLHDPAKLLPVIHILEIKVLHRRAGDDHAVEFTVLQFIKGFVEGQQMLFGGILGFMSGNHHQLQMDLQRRITQNTAQLGFRDDFCRHQVQQHDLQRTNMLGLCPGLFHNENVFVLKNTGSRQIIGYLNGHGSCPPKSVFIRVPAPGQYRRSDPGHFPDRS